MESLAKTNKHEYRNFIPDKGWARFDGVDYNDPYKYSEKVLNSDVLKPILKTWKANLSTQFYGVTNDGAKREGLYSLQHECAPTQRMVDTARRLLDSLSEEEKQLAVFPADSDDCRKWSNPELILYECGIRLEHLEENKIYLILELLRSSLSEKGFAKVRGAMKTNKFLGHICERQAILNEYSYWFSMYGQPSRTQPWGFLFFGHHLCLHILIQKDQMVIGPVFLGAEPCIIDSGPDEGVEICAEEGRLGLQLMQSLAPKHQQKAQTYVKMHDPVMPKGRYNPADQRHLAGAFQDNRVIPYEGVLAQNLTKEQQDLLMAIVAEFLILLPSKPLAIRLQQIRSWICETYFSWIGGYGPDDPFYYRIQSPVVLLEFDHHSGVFLTNEEPAKYHIHTIQRLPNGNDYGKEVKRMALLAAESRS